MKYPKGEYIITDFFNFKILKVLSGFSCDRNHKILVAIIYLSRIIFIYAFPSQIITYFQMNKFDVNSTVDYFVAFGVCLEMFVRNFFYSRKYSEYTELRAYINKYFWPISFISNKEKRESLEKKLQLLQYGCATFVMTLVISALMYCFYPMVEPISGQKSLPLRLWFPFDANPNIIHYILFCMLTCNGVLGCIWIAATDLLFIYFTSHLVVQINILRELVENINHISLDDEDNDHALIDDEVYQNLIYDRLKICTKHHEKLLTFHVKLQQLFNDIMLMQLFMSTSLLCIVGYAFIGNEELTKKINHLAIFISLSLELVIFCIPGSVLEQQNDDLYLSIYQSKWYLGNAKYRKSFMFFQYQTLYQSFTLSASGVFPINNLCLVQVYKLAFSCITMLQTLDENQ